MQIFKNVNVTLAEEVLLMAIIVFSSAQLDNLKILLHKNVNLVQKIVILVLVLQFALLVKLHLFYQETYVFVPQALFS
jgi:hypothetical protein